MNEVVCRSTFLFWLLNSDFDDKNRSTDHHSLYQCQLVTVVTERGRGGVNGGGLKMGFRFILYFVRFMQLNQSLIMIS